MIGFEIWGQLKQDWAEALGALKDFESSEKTLEKFFRSFQALDVREHLVRLDRKTEVLGRVGQPFLDGRFFYQLAKGEVDFDCI